MTDQIAGLENADLENDGLKSNAQEAIRKY